LFMSNILKQLFVCICLIFLGACGGSSSGGNSPDSQKPGSKGGWTQTGVPQNLIVTPGNQSATLKWSPVAGADKYSIYYATESGIRPQNIAAYENGHWIENVT